jgi:hypothetical protein
MRAALNNLQLTGIYSVNQPVCLINPATPKTGKVAGQGFRFPYTSIAIPVDVHYQLVNPF